MQKIFHLILEIVYSFQIVLSPLLIGSFIGLVVYCYDPSTTRLVFAILIGLAGLIIGIIWAVKVSKKEGASHFMSRIMATPELDKKREEDSSVNSKNESHEI